MLTPATTIYLLGDDNDNLGKVIFGVIAADLGALAASSPIRQKEGTRTAVSV